MSKLASASQSSSTTLNCSSNELGPTCLLLLNSMAVFAGKSCSISATPRTHPRHSRSPRRALLHAANT
ncbi:hypothetical protein FIBSPDRAFT_870448, partial [Athelia psychrophila]